jgi:hypothetical protein
VQAQQLADVLCDAGKENDIATECNILADYWRIDMRIHPALVSGNVSNGPPICRQLRYPTKKERPDLDMSK